MPISATDLVKTGHNMHPVDFLANVRETIKALGVIEDELKAQISKEMGDADSLGGVEYIAYQRLLERKGSLDEKAIAAALKVEDLSKFRKPPSTYITLRLENRRDSEAL